MFPVVSFYFDLRNEVNTTIKTFTLPEADRLRSYEAVRDRIVLQLSGRERYGKNGEMLSVPYGDMDVLPVILFETDKVNACTPVSRALLQTWNVPEEVLYDTALRNSEKLLPPEVHDIRDYLGEEGTCLNTIYVLTNKKQYYGASVILYPGLLENLAEALGDDLLLLPSSVHEFLILPAGGKVPEGLQRMVYEINRTAVAPGEVLSDSVYRYMRGALAAEPVETD